MSFQQPNPNQPHSLAYRPEAGDELSDEALAALLRQCGVRVQNQVRPPAKRHVDLDALIERGGQVMEEMDITGFANDPQDSEVLAAELDLYEKGRQLRTIYGTPGWEILMATFEELAVQTNRDLMKLLPGDPTVSTAHAVAFAWDDGLTKAKQGFEAAINFANKPSDSVRQYLFGVRDSLDVQKAMGEK